MRLPLGELTVPEDWDQSVQLTLREPESKRLSAPLAKKGSVGPRANITVRRFTSSARDASAALAQFLSEAKGVPRFRAAKEIAVRFADGCEGLSVTVSLEAAPGIPVAQRHVFRVDGGVVTQIAATVEGPRASDLEGDLAAIMLSYRLTS